MEANGGQTYRYATAQQLWNFGFGMSYTAFAYSDLQLTSNADSVTATVQLTNTGDSMLADEVVQLYVANPAAGSRAGCRSVPLVELKAFVRVRSVAPGATVPVTLGVPLKDLAVADHDCTLRVLAGVYTVHVGGRKPGALGAAEDGAAYGTPHTPLQAMFAPTASQVETANRA